MRLLRLLLLPTLALAPLATAQEAALDRDVARDRQEARDTDVARSSDRSSDSSSSGSSSSDRRADAERDAEDLERVLTLASGHRMRARARLDGDTWQVRRDGTWFPLAPGAVASQEPVKNILKEARKRERQLKLALADDRADQAFWLCERGLYTEALEHLEVALRKDPDHGPTLTLLDSGRLPMNLPARPAAAPGSEAFDAELDTYLASVARMQRASRELALAALDELPADALAEAFTADLAARDRGRRELAAQGLQRLVVPGLAGTDRTTDAGATTGTTTSAEARATTGAATDAGALGPRERAVQVLLERAVLDGSDDVRHAAARALRDLDEPAVTAPLVRALGSTSSAVRANAAESLGILAQPVAAPALVSALAATASSGGAYRPPANHIFVGRQRAYVQDYDVEAFSGAVAADPRIAVLTEGVVLDVRVLSVKQELARTHERSKLRGALRQLTGQDFRYDAGRWGEWLARHPLPEG